ncbi:MAG TPA: hypothetical protein VGE50_03070 [Gammaproteobacteria bacterium]
MEYVEHCRICSLNHPGSESSPFCSTCRDNEKRRRYCLAFAEHETLTPFLAADDIKSMRGCSRRLADRGHSCVVLEWSDELAHYRVV